MFTIFVQIRALGLKLALPWGSLIFLISINSKNLKNLLLKNPKS
jgi:hypothetical protein